MTIFHIIILELGWVHIDFFKLEHIIWMFDIFKPKRLFDIDFIFQIFIQEDIYHIHLIECEFHECNKGYEKFYYFKSCNCIKSFMKVNALFMILSLDHQMHIVSCNYFMLIKLVSEHCSVPMTILSFGHGTRCKALFPSNWFSSSCIEMIQSTSCKASLIFLGSIMDKNVLKAHKFFNPDLVVILESRSIRILAIEYYPWYLYPLRTRLWVFLYSLFWGSPYGLDSWGVSAGISPVWETGCSPFD